MSEKNYNFFVSVGRSGREGSFMSNSNVCSNVIKVIVNQEK
ncbi:hypothetical protein [Candidatus Nitrosocosmicus sp. SS]|nr:hypothetical protein [Candidatus Nitrosocosmicus sp. SS]